LLRFQVARLASKAASRTACKGVRHALLRFQVARPGLEGGVAGGLFLDSSHRAAYGRLVPRETPGNSAKPGRARIARDRPGRNPALEPAVGLRGATGYILGRAHRARRSKFSRPADDRRFRLHNR
jgi:hypothetical protein